MAKSKRAMDIDRRYKFVVAERYICDEGSEQYKTLTEIMYHILAEYTDKHSVRHSFRMYNGEYHMVILQSGEEI